MLRHDALDLLDDPDARLVADADRRMHGLPVGPAPGRAGCETDFQPLDASVGHHVPCHLKALGRPPAGPELLALIPGLRVHTIDVSCSGMAGTFGLKAANYAVSLAAGRPMLEELARPRVLFGSTECSTCRMQMEDGAGKRTLHPVQYLALAYGLMPESGPATYTTDSRSGTVMKLRVRLFARARDLAGADHVVVELPAGATVGRAAPRGWRRSYPRWPELLKRSAVAVDASLPAMADVA